MFDCLRGFAVCRCLNLICPLCFFCSFHFSFFSQGSFEIQQDDVSISYLPLAHMFERMIQVVDPLLLLFLCMNPKLNPFLLQVSMFCYGARVGFYQGDISLLMDDIKTLKPTFFPVVPRLLNRIYDKVSKRITRSSFSFTRCKVQQIHPLVKIMHQYSSLASAGSPGAVRPLHGSGFNPSWGYFLPAFPLSSLHCCIAIKLKSKKPHKIDWFKSRLIFLLR